MQIKKLVIPSILTIFLTFSSGIYAQAPCASGSVDACWQMCKIDGVDHMVCARSISGRMDNCVKRHGQLQPATSRCGWGLNCNGCED